MQIKGISVDIEQKEGIYYAILKENLLLMGMGKSVQLAVKQLLQIMKDIEKGIEDYKQSANFVIRDNKKPYRVPREKRRK